MKNIKSNAERQHSYRTRQASTQARLNLFITKEAKEALDRLSREHRATQKKICEWAILSLAQRQQDNSLHRSQNKPINDKVYLAEQQPSTGGMTHATCQRNMAPKTIKVVSRKQRFIEKGPRKPPPNGELNIS